jgi:monovalent cation/proton antiporter MnhG/PhaG subunit
MAATHLVVDLLLGLAVLIQILCVLGVWRMPNVLDRLHFLAPATSVAPWLVAGAIWTRELLDHQGIVALLIAVLMLGWQPVLAHVTARAAMAGERDRPRPAERSPARKRASA